jgi:hypothetical protein
MAVREVQEMWSRTSGDASTEDKFRKLSVRFQKAWQVTHDVETSDFDIYAAPTIPRIAEPFPGTAFVLATSAQLTRVSPIMSIISVEYQGEIGREFTESPLMAPPKIDWGDVEVEGEIDEDFDGRPIVNVLGDRIRGVKALFADQTVTIRRNMPTFNNYVQAVYRRSVNSDPFLGWPPGTAKMMQLSASNVFDKDMGYWEVTAQIQFRYPYRTTPDKAWYARTRNEGFYVRDTTGRKVRATDENQMPTVQPVLLKADGKIETNTENAHWLEFKLYGEQPYNALGLI